MSDLRAQLARVNRNLVGVGDERRVQRELAPLRAIPERQVAWSAERDRLGARPLVSDDRGAREKAVPEGVVAVVMRVDHRTNRSCRDGGYGLQISLSAPPRGAGVDADHALRSGQESGVVDPPGAVRLVVHEYARRYL